MKLKIYALFIIIFVFLSLAIFNYLEKQDEKLIKESFIQTAQYKSDEKNDMLKGYIAKLNMILFGIKDNKYFRAYLSSPKNNQDITENMFLSIIKTFPEVFQLRYIDINGDEKIRVEKLKNNGYTIVNSYKLQNKKHRYYFKDTLEKKDGELWYSKLDLNIEHNKIVKPIQPTLRIGTPVFIDNKKQGILIINVNIDYFLNKFIKSSIYQIYIVDKEGFIIKSDDTSLSWSRYLKTDKKIFDIIEDFDHKILNKDKYSTDYYYSTKFSLNNEDKASMIIKLKDRNLEKELQTSRTQRLYYFIAIFIITLFIAYIVYNRRYTTFIEDEKQKVKNILDSQESLVIMTNGRQLLDCNKRFLNFFEKKSLDEFLKISSCICDFFDKDPKYIQKSMEGMVWTDYLSKYTDRSNKVKIIDLHKKAHIFTAHINDFDIKKGIKIVTFNDITQIEYLTNHLEEMVSQKTKELKELNKNLEKRVEEEVDKNREKDKQLFEREKLAQMGEMIGNIAHQWRQPLSIISTAASGMKMQKEFNILNDDTFNSSINIIVDTTKFLSNTIDDFRNFIKDDKELKEFNLIFNLKQIIKIVKDSYKNNFIDIRLNADHDILIKSIPGELSQVILNILNNAKDALIVKDIQKKFVDIKVTNQKDKVIITIEDNGGGISEDIISKIYDPYFTTKHQSQGTGIGLYMSHMIVTQNLKGNIYVKNTQNGAKFFIELPYKLD